MKIFLTGISGTGKTTAVEGLKKRGILAIDLDDISRWHDKASGEPVDFPAEVDEDFMNSHEWMCDMNRLKSFLDKVGNSPVVVSGMLSERQDLASLFDKILLLTCDPEIFVNRLNSRDNNEFGKEKGVQDSIIRFHEKYRNKLKKLGAVEIDASKTKEEVLEEIINQLS